MPTINYLMRKNTFWIKNLYFTIFLLLSNSLLILAKTNTIFSLSDTLLINQSTVFEPTTDKYASIRIPALVITKKGALLAFASGRIGSGSAWADMDLIMKRSEDGGKSWGPIQIVAHRAGGKPTDNPTPIVSNDGTILLIYQRYYSYAYYTKSKDDGLTRSPAKSITATFDDFKEKYNWKVLAPGPEHSIQLKNGRLIVPVWLADSNRIKPNRSHHPSRIATIYSDDNGNTWNGGELVPDLTGFKNPSETMAVELADGRVALNNRNESNKKRRGISISNTGKSGWSTPEYFDDLFDPICMASIITINNDGENYQLFVNPDSKNIDNHPRANLTVKLSKDEGKTWPIKQVLNAGSSGYSDLALGSDNMFYCLYQTKANGGGTSLNLIKLNWQTLLN